MRPDIQTLRKKYEAKIEEELGTEEFTEAPSVSYSEAYRIFREEQLSIGHNLFERLCAKAEKILKIKLKQEEIDAMLPFLEMAHIIATPYGVYSLAALSTIVGLFSSFVIGLLLGNILIMLAGMLGSVSLFFLVPTIPKRMFLSWRAKASDQLILAVLYMVIYMEHTPNLELAVWFTAKHLSPPLSLDFIKLLWDVETKKYSTLVTALEDYIETWRGWDDAFIDSIHVLETSLAAGSKEEREKILEKSEEIILDGTYDKMMSFVHQLQSPVQTLHMLGTVLPVMGLVMLPMVSAFMGASIKWWQIALLYNILLPIAVYSLAKSILSTRPASSNLSTDIYAHLIEKYAKPKISPLFVGIGAASAFLVPTFFYFFTNPPIGEASFTLPPLIFSTICIAGIGLGIAAYYWYKNSTVLKIKRKITQIEEEFASAIFQLGSIMSHGKPIETALPELIEAMPKAEITDFFKIIDENIREKGMSLKEAIFDEKEGAITYFPSAIIKSVMNTLVEATKKSPQIASASLMTISRYLINAHRVNERLKDLLADTISSLASQIKLFAPAISGIVVGLSYLTTTILSNLGQKLSGFEAGGEVPFGAGLLDIFQIKYMTPGWQFQIIVGIYLIQIVFIMSMLLSGLVTGADKIESEVTLSKNLALGTTFYATITIACSLLFSLLIAGLTEVI
ncbi:MAG: hypothetical protein ACP5IJ_01935 [Candidatus Nanoarchaeia archaeon]